MAPRKSLALLFVLFLAACGTTNSSHERTPAASVAAQLADQVPSTATTSPPTTLPTYTLAPTQTPPPSTPPPLPTATPTPGAAIKLSPGHTPTSASASPGSRCDRESLYTLATPAFFFKSSEGKIYFLDGRERHTVDEETFLNLDYRETDIVNGSSLELSYPEGAPFTRLIKGSGEEVYWLENGFRRHIPDMDTFRQLGYRPADIFQMSDDLLGGWPIGEPVPSVLGTPPEPIPASSQERVVSSYRPFDRHARASELYTVSADGTQPRRLSFTTGYTYHRSGGWSPDGRSIASVQCLAHMPDDTSCEVFTTTPDAWKPQWLAREGYIGDLSWSPDGKRLAYTAQFIVVMEKDGAHKRKTDVESWAIAWTLDGRIAFWVREGDSSDKYKLMVVDADGQNVQPVETQITIFDQRYSPWRQCEWVAGGSPDYPAGQ